MNDRQTTKTNAAIVRKLHKRNGGKFTSTELAGMLGLHVSTIRLYLRNEVAIDEDYQPSQAHRLNAKAIRFLLNNGLDRAMIASLYNCSKRLVDLRLQNERENEQCPA